METRDRWDLSDLFADDEAFEAAKRSLQGQLAGLDRGRGRLGESSAILADCLATVSEASLELGRLRCYATLRSDQDTRVARYQAMQQEVELLYTELSRRLAFLRPEILGLDPARIEAFLAEEPRLAPHAFFLRDLLRQRPHVLGPSEEKILAEAGLLTRAPTNLYHILHDAELPRGEVTLSTGERVRMTPVAYHRHRTTSHRPDRLGVFGTFFRAYADFQQSLGQNLSAGLKSHLFAARARRYGSCLEAALDGDNIPVSVYRNLIERVREGLPLLHRYFRLRATALGLPFLEYADLYCPLSAAPPRRYSSEDARAVVLESLEPLGPNYVSALRSAFDRRWIDWPPAEGKRSGAYATGWAYEVHPYVLLNFTGDYDAVSTLAHEMGHAMHSHFSNRSQPYPTADYSIFVAEVASTLNEALLNRRLLATAADPAEQLYLVTNYLDGVRGTLFRQTMFAEFELLIHACTERGEALTGQRLGELYLDLLRHYHGSANGVVRIDASFGVEWAAIPHFYYDFYVYQYATGIVAATALAEALTRDGERARRLYLQFLGSGGSDYPLELLRAAGVDLELPDPYRATLAAFERKLELLEQLLVAAGQGSSTRTF
ncbi:MAG TPA: oligoendopeptidase F [Candidatus Polarisedimenticolaceae bacterium]|nr:oligoendopeptidase F [Candidatus Polarisedimenticolaceae bacterium]